MLWESLSTGNTNNMSSDSMSHLNMIQAKLISFTTPCQQKVYYSR